MFFRMLAYRRDARSNQPARKVRQTQKKPIPYVLGPGKQTYIVDHHHLARALWSLKIPEAILGDQLADWSDKETKEFWRLMESHHGVVTFSSTGQAKGQWPATRHAATAASRHAFIASERSFW